MGRSLLDAGTRTLPWLDLALIVQGLMRDPETLTWRDLAGPAADWTLNAQLLAVVANSANFLAWAKSKDGPKNRNKPHLILPPWLEQEQKVVVRRGDARMTLAETREWLGW